MTLSEFEKKRCEKLVAEFIERRRPPLHLRAELDLDFRVGAQGIEIFEVRPLWKEKTKYQEVPVAKAIYNRRKRTWKVFWQRADLKWHSYNPSPEVSSIEDFLMLVQKDEYGCFFG